MCKKKESKLKSWVTRAKFRGKEEKLMREMMGLRTERFWKDNACSFAANFSSLCLFFVVDVRVCWNTRLERDSFSYLD